MDAKSFGERLRMRRIAKGLTQKELAKKVGISQRMINYYENHAINPPISIISNLCNALKISSDELLDIKGLPNDESYKTDKNLLRRFKLVKDLSERDKRNVFAFIKALHSKIKTI